MDLKLLQKEKNEIKLQIEDPDDTLIYPLLTQLLKDEDVAEASYAVGHPMLDKPVLYIKTRKAQPKSALQRAAESLASQYSDAKKLLEKELK